MRDGGPHLAYSALFAFHIHLTMSTPSRFKTPLIVVLSLVLLCAGLAVLVGIFGLLVKVFGGG
ncbi:antibiotic biosynthesis monooxygenase (ABM) superfamily enzyme [Paraburkholderia terricola]|nr:antibiotic biosynthesis monooxygenase (ABM) superfamily enzyme [Paraburkholderia terricola]